MVATERAVSYCRSVGLPLVMLRWLAWARVRSLGGARLSVENPGAYMPCPMLNMSTEDEWLFLFFFRRLCECGLSISMVLERKRYDAFLCRCWLLVAPLK